VLPTNTREQTGIFERLLRRFAGITQPPASSVPFAPKHQLSLAVAAEVQASAHADGLALLHIPSGRLFLCNRTGSRIWRGLADGLSVDKISEQISVECGVARDLVERHTNSFLAELERRRLVTRKAGARS